jgi:hypothetical protein
MAKSESLELNLALVGGSAVLRSSLSTRGRLRGPSRSGILRAFFVLLPLTAAVLPGFAAEQSTELLTAATRGDTDRVQTLLRDGASIESTDKNDRTPLMLAAQHGHPDTVRVLLAAGANPDARDKTGLTAFGLTLLNPAGHADHEAVMKMLPQHPRFTLAVIAGWNPERLVSSCFQRREQSIQQFGLMRPDETLLRELQAFATSSGRGIARLAHVDAKAVEPLRPEPVEDTDAVVTLEIEPGAACSGGTADSLNFAIDVRVFRAHDLLLLSQKSFGGGLKGLRAQTVENASQYKSVYEAWMKAQAGPIYWAIVEVLMRSSP